METLPLHAGVAEGLARLREAAETASLAGGGQFKGSNNWVVSGATTASGKPILANDMHLGIGAPSIWYQNHLVVQGLRRHRGHLPRHPRSNRRPQRAHRLGDQQRRPGRPRPLPGAAPPRGPRLHRGEWYRATVEQHEIKVKGKAEPVPFAVYHTRHGPLISEVVEELEVPCSLRWTALGPTREVVAVLGLAEA